MTLPFTPPALGTPWLHDGARIIYFGDRGDDHLDIRDGRSGGPYQPRDPKTGMVVPTTVPWLRQEVAAKRLKPVGPTRVGRDGRREAIALLDSVAAQRKDAKSTWRFQWALAAKRAGVARTDDAYRQFIADNAKNLRHDRFDPPGASSVRRHVRELEEKGAFQAVFISGAGRAKGRSQLPEVEDTLVHDVAQRFWATREWPSISDAWSVLEGEWKALRAAGMEGLSKKAPSYETLRLRIRSLQTRSTVAFKYGEQRAARLYDGLGDAVPIDRPLEVAFMDGFELRQVVNFGDDLPTEAGKMKTVALICGCSTFVWPPQVFAGDYRAEQSVGALLNLMLPSTCWTEEQLAEFPWMGWIFRQAITVVPDHDRALVPPAYLPGLLALDAEVALPETYDPNAKNKVESFGKWLKGRLSGLPGTVAARRRRRDERRDDEVGAELSMHQLRQIVLDLVWEWNTKKRPELGDRSPYDLMVAEMLKRGGPEIVDLDHVQRTLARADDATLTTDGILYDGIRYRNGPGPDVVGRLLQDNAPGAPVRSHLDGTCKIRVQIRTYEQDLDYIEVLNDLSGDWERLWSTEPEYTAGLSRWEHGEYTRLARERSERLDVPGAMAAARRRTLEHLEAKLPNMALRQRKGLAVFRDCEQVRRLSGARAARGVPQLSRQAPHGTGGRTPASPPPPATDGSSRSSRTGSRLPRRNWDVEEGDEG